MDVSNNQRDPLVQPLPILKLLHDPPSHSEPSMFLHSSWPHFYDILSVYPIPPITVGPEPPITNPSWPDTDQGIASPRNSSRILVVKIIFSQDHIIAKKLQC